jgi:hypothetical protein
MKKVNLHQTARRRAANKHFEYGNSGAASRRRRDGGDA